jgi:hypothetical protein
MKKMLFSFPILLAMVAQAGAVEPATPSRLDEVAERGAKVMPFNLDKTVHIFNKTETGGVQQVIAKNASDAEQIRLIREHLAHIAASFAQGDFSGPASIHGPEMPGLAELRAGAEQVQFAYRDLPDGAQIDYSTDQPALVDAIHRFFDAQLSDHARHAITGHQGHHP